MQNNPDQSTVIALTFIIVGLLAFSALIFAVLAFLAFILTLMAFWAWRKPYTLLGETVTPEEARGFVYRGIAGAVVVTVFAHLTATLFHTQVPPRWNMYLVIAGYCLGSVVMGYVIEQEKRQAAEMQLLNPPTTVPAEPIDAEYELRDTAQASFRFATWDDEEELRR